MLKARLFRAAFALGATSLLLWRIVDFVNEAGSGAFHITRAGLALRGTPAELVELFVIAACGAFAGLSLACCRRLKPEGS